MNEREIERKKRYETRMKKVFEQILEKNNIELVYDDGYVIKLKYKDVEFGLYSHTDWNSWTRHYQVWIVEGDKKTLATRCLLETAITKAKKYIDEREQ